MLQKEVKYYCPNDFANACKPYKQTVSDFILSNNIGSEKIYINSDKFDSNYTSKLCSDIEKLNDLTEAQVMIIVFELYYKGE